MKKFFLSIALSLLTASTLFAAKAKPGICQIQLTDGTYVSATLHGDENFHYYAMTDGTPLQEVADGKYEITSLESLYANQNTARARAANRASSIGTTTNPPYFPHVGSPKVLVILVQFQDVKFQSNSPYATFNHYLNGKVGDDMPVADKSVFFTGENNTNYAGVRQYFSDMSDGKFTPQFYIVGPVTVSQKSAYYGKNAGSEGEDQHYVEMMQEACQQVDEKVNFADYDSNNDGYADLVYFIYAGYSESEGGNSSDCLWPKSGTATIGTFDGKKVSRFGINNELNSTPKIKQEYGKYLINGIGLFCHEFSHTLGLPDLYPVDNAQSANNQSPEYWDLMDMGEYTGDGYYPTPYSPWEKSLMGWAQPETLSSTQAQQISLEPYDIASKSLKIEAESNGEYLLLQNIRNEGWFKKLYGYGLLVWRIDYADINSVNIGDYPNKEKGKPRVMIVPADGLVINSVNAGNSKSYTTDEYKLSLENDPFPMYKAGSATEYEVNSLTSVQLNHSTLTTRPLYNIEKDEMTGMVTFDYLKDFSATGIQDAIIDHDAQRPLEYFDLEGRKVQHPQKGHLYITNKGKKVVL